VLWGSPFGLVKKFIALQGLRVATGCLKGACSAVGFGAGFILGIVYGLGEVLYTHLATDEA
jgi:hypothetical protein